MHKVTKKITKLVYVKDLRLYILLYTDVLKYLIKIRNEKHVYSEPFLTNEMCVTCRLSSTNYSVPAEFSPSFKTFLWFCLFFL